MNNPLKINFASNGILLSLRSKDLCSKVVVVVAAMQVVDDDSGGCFIITSFANFLDGSKQSTNALIGVVVSLSLLVLLLLSSSSDEE